MEKQQILETIEKHLRQSVPDLGSEPIDPTEQLTDYGANSLDIVEIVSSCMRELKIKIPRHELSEIENIGGLVDKFLEHAK